MLDMNVSFGQSVVSKNVRHRWVCAAVVSFGRSVQCKKSKITMVVIAFTWLAFCILL